MSSPGGISNYASTPDALGTIAANFKASEAQENAESAEVAADALQQARRDAENDTQNIANFLKRQSQKPIRPQTSAVKEAKQKAEGKVKLLPPGEIKEFLGNNPQYKNLQGSLEELVSKLKDGMSKKDILDLINNNYTTTEDRQLALEFLSAISLDDFKKVVDEALGDFHLQINSQRAQELEDKDHIEEQPATDGAHSAKHVENAQMTAELAEKSKLSKKEYQEFVDHLIANPRDLISLYKLFDDSNQSNMIKELSKVQRSLGRSIDILKDIESDKENAAKMRAVMDLLRQVRSISMTETYYDNRCKSLNK